MRVGHGLRHIFATSMAAALVPAALSFAAPSEPTATDTARSIATAMAVDAAKDSLTARCRCWLRKRVVSRDDLASYGLVLDDAWQKADATRPVVIVIHGYNSSPEKNQAILRAAREAGYPCGTFAYPNDYTIADSARQLSRELRRLARLDAGRRVALVCHSMGGLVARACVEDPRYDPGNVDRLIMIAPPNFGTAVAHFAIGTDLWEHWIARSSGSPWRRVHDSVVDGLGEAADELCPGSEFLDELNSRRRNPSVHYSVILGTGARFSEAELDWVRQSVLEKLATVPGARRGANRLDSLLDDLDELVEGKGDGVVAVARGRLDGVADTLVLPFGHLAVTGEPATDVIRQVQQAVLERLN
jgi:pimeloyl-ACP methyl ester carboxylesterase